MKLILDCVVTASDPAKCSSNIQFLTFVKRTLARRNDVFFYWLIPDWIADDLFEKTYPQHPNVKYLRIPQHKDRTKEYLTLRTELDKAVAFNGDLWDYDALLTMRTGQLPLLRMLGTSPRTYKQGWMRQFWLIEEMVIMEFKETVLSFAPTVQDIWTLNGFLAADYAWMVSQTDKPFIMRRARELLAPSLVRELDDKLTPVGYAQFAESSLKTPDQFPDPNNGKPICIAHAGRMEMANGIEAVNKVMVNNFVMYGDKVELLVCTVSSVIKTFDQSVVNVKQASRDEFWELCRSKMHVIIKLSAEGGSSLALLEPLMFGVPAIVGPRSQTERALGADYPFIVNSEVEAYAMTKLFIEDYADMYAKFAAWHQTKLQELIKTRFEDFSLYRLLDKAVDGLDALDQRIAAEKKGKKDNALVTAVVEAVKDRNEFVFKDVIAELVEKKLCDAKMLDKLQPGDRDTRGLVWSTDFHELLSVIRVFHGWEHASTAVGHLKRKEPVFPA